ncbi:DUF397 domain-containing protein [Streptomyces pathocidini]|uniref:DUF397 domain-containing protein n=1 Tax=Streptomyces pathocidini TaxID=1650571 RepID=A0ABW7UVK3_9ACTN|nr:DUF397 domain-containing protein [Streptomyces pathocidini]
MSTIWRKSSYSSAQGGECIECAPLAGAAWRKSTYSSPQGGDCIECSPPGGATWQKSSYSSSQGGDCIECAQLTGSTPAVAVRDSKNADGPRLHFSAMAWKSFLNFAATQDVRTI